ncbi:rRNA methyltransferase 2, mitochondrial-like [Oppia nitens]|uniref:rRNA methyltransferase 2, mitochondrial-like n=1 Tax=Oppia nitens TaxID=1686743 RepID=UPI0023DA231B|nr:rRNA methyltransferase 2, mitochondrial-like [Oppia nitens]
MFYLRQTFNRHLCRHLSIRFKSIKDTNVWTQSAKCFHLTECMNKTTLKNTSGKSQSSQDWLRRQMNDPYVKKARYNNYRARSVFKLMEMDNKYQILHPSMIVVECGAAPGSWTQYIVKQLKLDAENTYPTGAVIAIDMRAINPIAGAIIMDNMDFTKPLNQSKILHALNGKLVDVVVSDMAPNASGNRDYDSTAIHNLCYSVLQFSLTVLKPISGTFLTKIWAGNDTEKFIHHLNQFFNEVTHLRPDACRADSTESYIMGRYFKGIQT